MQANELFTQPNTILLDGGMGTMLQAAGLKLGARPEELNITDPQLIESIHSRYAAAGSRIINANTFGASAHKLAGSEYTLEEIIAAGIANCKRACAPYGALAALDVGPLGELLEPNGTLAFEDAVTEYGRIVRAGVAAGADLVFFETFTDLYELKAALLAAKENCGLPILASMSFEAGGRTFTGCTVESFAVTARGLGANAVGINCSLGPKEIFPMAKRLAEALPGDFPVFVKPNAGLPRADGSGYDICRRAKALGDTPVVFLTACDEEVSAVMGLDMGGDDYITKPFRVRELISRIKSVLRRYKGDSNHSQFKLGDLRVNTSEARVWKQGEEVLLTALEYRLLLAFLNHPGQVLTRGQLLENIWDVAGDFVNDNTLTVYIKRLRDKLEQDPQDPQIIKTVRGVGYKLEKEGQL